jgi:hypothetical protein
MDINYRIREIMSALHPECTEEEAGLVTYMDDISVHSPEMQFQRSLKYYRHTLKQSGWQWHHVNLSYMAPGYLQIRWEIYL